jgi:four helix bundle protein
VRSAPSNIAEGFGRFADREFVHFLSIARGSLMEAQNHLADARKRGLIESKEYETLELLARRALIATPRLLRSVKNRITPRR